MSTGVSSPVYVGVFEGHMDPAAALVRDGRLLAYAEEERFIRNKHAFGVYPTRERFRRGWSLRVVSRQLSGVCPPGRRRSRKLLRERRRRSGTVDAIVGVSGGKDSAYVLLQLRDKYGLNVEALTYVHDGSTPIAVDNARKTCEALGVRQHVVSLPNHRHLRSFQRFFAIWLTSRNSLAAAMTCVACKHLHLMATRIAARHSVGHLGS